LNDANLAGLKVNVAPPQAAELALTCAGIERQRVERGRLRAGSLGDLEEGARLGGRPSVLPCIIGSSLAMRLAVQIGRDVSWNQSAMGPVWAPRGDAIAFGLGVSMPRQGQYGSSQIVIMAPDGSGVRRVTPNGEGNYHFPAWSPDGTRLVLRVATPTSKGLAILDVASGRLTPLTSGGGTDDNLPKWSPNGTEIVFTSDRDGDYDLYTIRPDGTALRRLTNTPGNDAHAAWSPDGRWIAFSSARGGFKDEAPRGGGGQPATDIFVMRPDGTDVRRLTDDAAEEGTTTFAWK
jgi:Tol biopolymer transport system component